MMVHDAGLWFVDSRHGSKRRGENPTNSTSCVSLEMMMAMIYPLGKF